MIDTYNKSIYVRVFMALWADGIKVEFVVL